jgi:hypothetical protein
MIDDGRDPNPWLVLILFVAFGVLFLAGVGALTWWVAG